MAPSPADLSQLLLTPEEAVLLDAHGRTDAAVLVPMYGWPDRRARVHRAPLRSAPPRRRDLFPGGRQDEPDEDLLATALREAQEEIGLDPARVELAGALPPIGTYVTSYKVHPFVGLIPEGLPLEPNPAEVETVLTFALEKLRGAYAMRRLLRRGVPVRTPTFEVDGHMIWGATGRILQDLLERLN